jgi:hypothetical protein
VRSIEEVAAVPDLSASPTDINMARHSPLPSLYPSKRVAPVANVKQTAPSGRMVLVRAASSATTDIKLIVSSLMCKRLW